MEELPETYVKSALYGRFYFLNDESYVQQAIHYSRLLSCPIKADGKPDLESIAPVDMSDLDDTDYDNIWNISMTLEEIAV